MFAKRGWPTLAFLARVGIPTANLFQIPTSISLRNCDQLALAQACAFHSLLLRIMSGNVMLRQLDSLAH